MPAAFALHSRARGCANFEESMTDKSLTPPSLPLSSLLALTTASFIIILTEVLPAGLLPQLAASLDSSQAVMGQLISVYALGSVLAAIPLASATQGVGRRTLLLAAIGGFTVVNTVTALSTSLPLIFVARFLGGVAAGLAWPGP